MTRLSDLLSFGLLFEAVGASIFESQSLGFWTKAGEVPEVAESVGKFDTILGHFYENWAATSGHTGAIDRSDLTAAVSDGNGKVKSN